MAHPVANTTSFSTAGTIYEVLPKDGVETVGHPRSPIVRAVNAVSVTGLTLNKATTTIVNGASEYLIATVTPTNALNKKVNWTSGTPAKATVTKEGRVTALVAGTSVITATSDDDSTKLATCTVTVS